MHLGQYVSALLLGYWEGVFCGKYENLSVYIVSATVASHMITSIYGPSHILKTACVVGLDKCILKGATVPTPLSILTPVSVPIVDHRTVRPSLITTLRPGVMVGKAQMDAQHNCMPVRMANQRSKRDSHW